MSPRFRTTAVCLIIVCRLARGRGMAQSVSGTILGTIQDDSGGAIASAHVSVVNTATDATRDVVANKSGSYAAPNLLPAVYSITITAPGYAPEERTGITLTVGGELTVNVTL